MTFDEYNEREMQDAHPHKVRWLQQTKEARREAWEAGKLEGRREEKEWHKSEK